MTKIDMESADLIRQHANHVLERDYPQESQRAELQKQEVSTVEEVKMSRGNNGAVSTDILHFRGRVLAVYGQGMFMGNL